MSQLGHTMILRDRLYTIKPVRMSLHYMTGSTLSTHIYTQRVYKNMFL